MAETGAAQSWPANLEDFWEWHADAACRDLGEGVVLLAGGRARAAQGAPGVAAKAVCAGCRVRELCAAYAPGHPRAVRHLGWAE